jgi:hypothetical protein
MIPGGGDFAFHIPSESVFTSLRNPYSEFPGMLIHIVRIPQLSPKGDISAGSVADMEFARCGRSHHPAAVGADGFI